MLYLLPKKILLKSTLFVFSLSLTLSLPIEGFSKSSDEIIALAPLPESGSKPDWKTFVPNDRSTIIFAGDLQMMFKESLAEVLIMPAPDGQKSAKDVLKMKLAVTVSNRRCEEFIFSHSPSRIVYRIPEGVTKFTALGAAIDNDKDSEGTWGYVVLINGEKVFETPWLVKSPTDFVEISVPIPKKGARTIELRTVEGKNYNADKAIWAWPYFHKDISGRPPEKKKESKKTKTAEEKDSKTGDKSSEKSVGKKDEKK